MLIARHLPIALAGLGAWPPAVRLAAVAPAASVARLGGHGVAMTTRDDDARATNEFIRSIAKEFKAPPSRGGGAKRGVGFARQLWPLSVALSAGFAAGCRLPRSTPLGAPVATAIDAALAAAVSSVVVVAIFGAIAAVLLRVARIALKCAACIFDAFIGQDD